MDAKAKVVAYRYVDQNGYLRVSLDRNWHGTEEAPLIPLTDHEAALAEAVADIEKVGPILIEWCDKVTQSRQAREKAEAKLTTLLTGLEALAVRLRPDVECAPWVIEAIRTLTNSAKGGEKESTDRGQFSKCDNCGSGPWNTGWDPDCRERKSKKLYCPNCTGAT